MASSIAFAKEMINSALNNTAISFSPFFKYPLGSNYSTLYPELTILLKDYIPTLKNNTQLINTIHNLTGVNRNTIIQDLTWGNGPEINILQLGLDPNGQEVHGKFNTLEPNKIFLDIDLIQRLETLASIINPTPQQVQQLSMLDGLVTFSVCLHEYVHYSDYAFDGTMSDTENIELGLLFEEQFIGGYYEFNPSGNVILIKAN